MNALNITISRVLITHVFHAYRIATIVFCLNSIAWSVITTTLRIIQDVNYAMKGVEIVRLATKLNSLIVRPAIMDTL